MEGTLQQKSTNMLGGWKSARWFELERNQIVPRYDPPHVLAEEAKLIANATDEKVKKELEARQAQRAAVLRRASSKPTLAPQLDLDGASVEKDGRDAFVLRKKGWATPDMAYRIDSDAVKDAALREKERDVWVAALAVFKASPNRPLREPTSPALSPALSPVLSPTMSPATSPASPKLGPAPAPGGAAAVPPASPQLAPLSPQLRASVDSKAQPFFVFPEATVRGLKACFRFLQEHKNVQLGIADPSITVALTRSALMTPKFSFSRSESPATVAAVCKALLKRLPESPFSNALLEPFIDAAVDNKVEELRGLLGQLPLQHRDIVKSVLNTARKFMRDEKNALTPANVANALGPALTPVIRDEKEYAAKWKDKFIGLFTVLMSMSDPLFSPPSSPTLNTRELITPLVGPTAADPKAVPPVDSAVPVSEGSKTPVFSPTKPGKSADAPTDAPLAPAAANTTAEANTTATADANTTAAADANTTTDGAPAAAAAAAPAATDKAASVFAATDKAAAKPKPASPAKPAAPVAPDAAATSAGADADQVEGTNAGTNAGTKADDKDDKKCRACDSNCVIC